MTAKSDLELANSAFNSWITAGSITGNVNVVQWYLDKATAELTQAIEKSDVDGDHAESLNSLALALEQVKISAAAVNTECQRINEDRLTEYKKICNSEEI
jgi:hypothetical protein